jgi:hypothetical protein
MVNKPKKQGTTFETQQVNLINKYSEFHKARRLAEGGNNDEGDIEFQRIDFMMPNEIWIMEAKFRQAFNLHQGLAKAKRKAKNKPVVLAWKKLKKVKGQKRRVTDGEPVVYCMDEKTFFALLKGSRVNELR